MADHINVKTDALRIMAGEVSTELNVISGEFDSMINVINNTASYWEGDSANAFRARINTKREKMEMLVSRLSEYIDDLNTMGQVYDTAEKQAQQLSAALESDVIY